MAWHCRNWDCYYYRHPFNDFPGIVSTRKRCGHCFSKADLVDDNFLDWLEYSYLLLDAKGKCVVCGWVNETHPIDFSITTNLHLPWCSFCKKYVHHKCNRMGNHFCRECEKILVEVHIENYEF